MKPSNPQVLFPQTTPLTPSMFGDPKCKAFGLHNNQIRGNSKINSAGWFNLQGQRLGSGDLELKDMLSIANHMADGEVFIALTEIDSMYDMPSFLNHGAPGKDYVVQKAVWVIGRDGKYGAAILRIRDDITKPEERTEDGIRYFRYPRKDFYAGINYTPNKITGGSIPTVKKPIVRTNEEKIKEAMDRLRASAPKKVSSAATPPPNGPSGSVYSGSFGGGQGVSLPTKSPNITQPSAPKKMVKKIKKVSKP